MSQVYSVPINQEHSVVSFDHEFLNVLRGRNLSLDIEQLYNVGTLRFGSEESSGYIAAVVSHLTAPLDEVDLADADRVETIVCGCDGWYHHAYDQQVGAVIDDCRHTEQIRRQRRTDVDDQQQTLGES